MVEYFGKLNRRASAYAELAKHNMSPAAQDTLGRLNTGKPRTYSEGDSVAIYFPRRALGDNWKPKHSGKWRGPMVINKRLSNSAYEMTEVATNQVFQRTVANINPYRAPTPAVNAGRAAESKKTNKERKSKQHGAEKPEEKAEKRGAEQMKALRGRKKRLSSAELNK